MTLTVKLEPELELALARRCKQGGVPKSVIVKRALSEFLAKEPLSAYEAGKDLFGHHGSGKGDLSDLSIRRREYFAEIVNAKRSRRR